MRPAPNSEATLARTKTRPYFPELDGIRAIAALMVMFFHFPGGGPLGRFMVLGQTGVDLFFVLSGFLITTILLQSPHGDWQEVRKFYIRRTLRIFPLYYGYLALSCVVFGMVSRWFWVYLQNWPIALGADLHGPAHFWSLAVEEQFYLVWPFLVLFWPRRWLSGAMWGAVVLALITRIAVAPFHFSSFFSTITRLDGLAAGGLLAWYYLHGKVQGRKTLLGSLSVIFGLALVAQWWVNHGGGAAWVQVTKYTLAAGFYVFATGLVLATRDTVAHRFLRSRAMRMIGRVSYGLYVFHPAVFQLLEPHLARFSWAIRAAISFGTVFVVALVSWYAFEKRFVDLKDRFAPEKKFRDASAARTNVGDASITDAPTTV